MIFFIHLIAQFIGINSIDALLVTDWKRLIRWPYCLQSGALRGQLLRRIFKRSNIRPLSSIILAALATFSIERLKEKRNRVQNRFLVTTFENSKSFELSTVEIEKFCSVEFAQISLNIYLPIFLQFKSLLYIL